MTFIQAQYRTALGTCKYVVGTLCTHVQYVHTYTQMHSESCKLEARSLDSRASIPHVTVKKCTIPNTHITLPFKLSLSLTHTYLAHNVMVFQVSSQFPHGVGLSFSRGFCGRGRLTHSEAACLVETRLWMLPWRSKSWGPIRLQSCRGHMDNISKHGHTYRA